MEFRLNLDAAILVVATAVVEVKSLLLRDLQLDSYGMHHILALLHLRGHQSEGKKTSCSPAGPWPRRRLASARWWCCCWRWWSYASEGAHLEHTQHGCLARQATHLQVGRRFASVAERHGEMWCEQSKVRVKIFSRLREQTPKNALVGPA